MDLYERHWRVFMHPPEEMEQIDKQNDAIVEANKSIQDPKKRMALLTKPSHILTGKGHIQKALTRG